MNFILVSYGMGMTLLTFIIGHGVIELSVVFIAGSAGLQLAWALINPGVYTRRDALAPAAQRAATAAVKFATDRNEQSRI